MDQLPRPDSEVSILKKAGGVAPTCQELSALAPCLVCQKPDENMFKQPREGEDNREARLPTQAGSADGV